MTETTTEEPTVDPTDEIIEPEPAPVESVKISLTFTGGAKEASYVTNMERRGDNEFWSNEIAEMTRLVVKSHLAGVPGFISATPGESA